MVRPFYDRHAGTEITKKGTFVISGTVFEETE